MVQNSRTRWVQEEEERLKQFCLMKKQSLLLSLYKNILVGCLRFRKEAKLFLEMSEFVGKTPEQCKSKMQKFEKKVYCKFLQTPEEHFQVFEWLRNKKSKKRETKNLEKIKEEDNQMEIKRQNIVKDIQTGKIIFEGN